jgi:alanine racemase
VARAVVRLAALERNLERIRARLARGVRVLAPVKANAYGHGAVRVARHLEGTGVDWFGVATAEEALELRSGGVTGRILLFGPSTGGYERLLEADVTPSVTGEHSLEEVRRAAKAVRRGTRVHLKVDTGMGRLGGGPDASVALARTVDAAPELELEGVWTHFASADDDDPSHARAQIARFEETLTLLEGDGIRPAIRHAANSPATLALPEAHYDLVRPGIALYGYHSSDATVALEPALEPILTLSAPVTFVKRVRPGTTVSYGAEWRAERETTIATVRIGYADGYPRGLSGRGVAVVNGARVPVAGRVCMDQIMLDVGDVSVTVGDEAVLFGPEGPTAEDLGRACGTISYEVLVRLGSRVAREYV